MAFTVVLDHPPAPGRSGRMGGLRAGGYLMLAVSSLFGIPFAILTIGGIVAIAAAVADAPFVPDEWVGPVIAAWVVCLAVTATGRVLGDRWVRRNRRLVLFLRRFGHTAATEAITLATARVGRSWRFVTLDDQAIEPVGVSGASRGLVRASDGAVKFGKGLETFAEKAGAAITTLGFLGGVGSLVYLLANEPDRVDQVSDWSEPAGSTAVLVFRISVGLLALAAAGFAVWLVVGLLSAFAVAAGQPLGEARRAIEFADKHQRLRASSESGVDAIRGRITTISRRVFSPRLYVVRVHSRVWQYAIRGFASDVDLPLIDISDPTENVLWEVRNVLHWFGPRCVVVGEYGRLGRFFDGSSAAGEASQTVLRLLDGVEVLGYTTDPAGQRRFVTALRNKLEDHVLRPAPAALRETTVKA